MAAVYQYNLNDKSEMFKAGIQVISGVKVDFLSTLLNPESLCVITEMSMQNSETVQFFLTFDDVISWFYFGKGMGSLTIGGILLTNDKGTPGLSTLLGTVLPELRGTAVRVSMGSATFECLLTSFTLDLTQDPSPLVRFSLMLNIVNHTLKTNRNPSRVCDFNPSGYLGDVNVSPTLSSTA